MIKWIIPRLVYVVHEEQLAEHGGNPKPNIFDLAAAYAYGIIKNHPFIDGNKRTGFLLAYIFLRLNGYELNAPEAEAVLAVYSLASGEWIEKDFSRWLEHWSLKDL